MNQLRSTLTLALYGLLISGCASPPVIDATGADRHLTPDGVVRNIDASLGHRVLWGGGIIASTNLHDATRLEVLAYPLDSSQHPDDDAKPLGRFYIIRPGYLETMDFAQGRRVTVRGPIVDVRSGRVGNTPYLYPVVGAEDLYLWPQAGRSEAPDVSFHFGFFIHN